VQTIPPKWPLPKFSREDAENQLRQAAEAYKLDQSEENREVLREAVWNLQQFDPPIEEWKGGRHRTGSC